MRSKKVRFYFIFFIVKSYLRNKCYSSFCSPFFFSFNIERVGGGGHQVHLRATPSTSAQNLSRRSSSSSNNEQSPLSAPQNSICSKSKKEKRKEFSFFSPILIENHCLIERSHGNLLSTRDDTKRTDSVLRHRSLIDEVGLHIVTLLNTFSYRQNEKNSVSMKKDGPAVHLLAFNVIRSFRLDVSSLRMDCSLPMMDTVPSVSQSSRPQELKTFLFCCCLLDNFFSSLLAASVLILQLLYTM